MILVVFFLFCKAYHLLYFFQMFNTDFYPGQPYNTFPSFFILEHKDILSFKLCSKMDCSSRGERLIYGDQKCFLANALPVEDFRYFSKATAFSFSLNVTHTSSCHGLYADAYIDFPQL